jgi:hypothetical protein
MLFNLSAQGKKVLVGKTESKSDTHLSGEIIPAARRFTLPGSEGINMSHQPVRLPAGYRRLYIVTGRAYVTYNQEDYVLPGGSELSLNDGSADAVVSGMGTTTLIFDLLK